MIKGGDQIVPSPTLESIRAYVQEQLAHEIWPEEQRFENPHRHYLDMSPDYYHMKMDLLNRIGRKK
jgi:putative nicotinate phosphoribosyltransferase